MILFRSYKNRILLASLAFALFGAIQASFILPASTISKENVDVNVNLVNGVAIRILDSAATAEITELDLSATAAPTGTFVADDFKVEVSTANKTGYKLYMSSSYQDTSTSTYTTDLVNQTNTSYTISTVPVATTKTDLGTAAPGSTNANKWAYSLDDATYSPVPANSAPTQIGSHDTPTAGTKTPVYIGMNVNVEKPSGVYKNQLTFSAVGNPITTDYSLYFLPGTTDPTEVSNLPPTQTASVVAASHTFTIPTLQQYSPTRDGYNFTGYLDESTSTTYQPGDTITVQGDIDYTGSATLTAQWGIVSSTLTVDPNGGTWSGSTSTQTFPGDYGDTKVIANPSASYTISYNDNSQSATYSPNPPAPTSVSRPFTGWTLTATGGGSPSGSFDTTTNTYTYNIASDTLTAGYNSTSNTFTLPTVTKAGHTCTWHENSASGASHASGETNVTITSNTEFYAVCAANSHNVTVTAGTGIASTTGSGAHDYNTNVAITATLSAGYHFADPKWTVNSGGVTISNDSFTMPDNDVSVTANGAINTCSVHYNLNAPSGSTSSGTTSNSSFSYGTTTATTANGFTVVGYDWAGWAESAGGTAVITTSGGNITATQAANWCGTHGTTKELYAKWTIKSYTLTVNPNGGTWNGSTSSQQFTQDYGTTKTIANPTAGPTYTIGYDMGSTGITAPTSPTSVQRPFSSWSLSGAGSFAGNTYTYEAGNGTLTASYSGTSNAFTLPALTKTGHTCKWHLGSASGTEYASGATNVTITGNTTFYATCTANNYTVNITNSNTTSGASSLSVPYGGSKTVTVTPSSGYYLSSVSCPSGYTCTGFTTGTSATGAQTGTITNNNTTSGGTLSFTGTLLRTPLQQACDNASTGSTFTYSNVQYIKLKTNSAGTTTACYTKTSQGTATFDNAASLCPSDTGVPTQGEFQSLIDAYGRDGAIYHTTGWSGVYWSSTPYDSSRAYRLAVRSSYATIGYYDRTASSNVVCIVR